jgi:ABC-type nitrate/sulfonate/bicarbonate transport system permease component
VSRWRSKGNEERWVPLGVLPFLLLLALWDVAVLSGWAPESHIPRPWKVVGTLFEQLVVPFAGNTLPVDAATSLGRWAMGFALGVLVAVPLGLVMAWVPTIDYMVSPVFEVLRFIPPLAWVPFAILWFGVGPQASAFVIVTGVLPPILVNTYVGARAVPRAFVDAARTLGTPAHRMLFEVLVPAALPVIVAGIRIGAGLGWMSLIGSELIAVRSGLGYKIVIGMQTFRPEYVISGMVAIGFLGFAIDLATRVLERRVLLRLGEAG